MVANQVKDRFRQKCPSDSDSAHRDVERRRTLGPAAPRPHHGHGVRHPVAHRGLRASRASEDRNARLETGDGTASPLGGGGFALSATRIGRSTRSIRDGRDRWSSRVFLGAALALLRHAAPWTGSTPAEKTESAVASIASVAPTVWGGDWNHAMSGREWSGSQQGRRSILEAVDRLEMQLPTADSPHQIEGLLSIDHIAVPKSWSVLDVEHHPARSDGARISDHDAYVIDAT